MKEARREEEEVVLVMGVQRRAEEEFLVEKNHGGGDYDGLNEEWRGFEASKNYFEVGQCYKFVALITQLIT